MESGKHLVIILSGDKSTRLVRKNMLEVAPGLTCTGRVVDIGYASGADQVIISSNDTIDIPKIAVKHNAHVVRRSKHIDNHVRSEAIAAEAICRYQQETGKRYQFFTVMYGVSIFMCPSWIKEAVRILREEEFIDKPVTHVMPTDTPHSAVCFQRMTPPPVKENPFFLSFNGITLDIDHPYQFEWAKKIFSNIQDGTIDYPLIENFHSKAEMDMGTGSGLWGGHAAERHWHQIISDLYHAEIYGIHTKPAEPLNVNYKEGYYPIGDFPD